MKIVRDGAHFIGVGAIQLALDSAIYIALTKLGLALTLANVCGRAAGACCGFWLNGASRLCIARNRRCTRACCAICCFGSD